MTQNENKPQREQDTGRWVQEKLDLLTPQNVPPAKVARAELDARIMEKENNMWQKIFAKKYRPAWATLVVIAVLAISLSFPQVRAVASSFLGLFRVERIEAVNIGISLSNLPGEMETHFKALDNLIGDQLQVEEVVEPVEVGSAAEASTMVGFPARAPANPSGETRIFYQSATSVKLVIDREQWQALIDGMGFDDFVLPESADGAEVKFNIPDTVVIGIGDCEYNEINEVKVGSTDIKNCTVFMQSKTPSIEAPPEIDINRAGQVLLQAMGMSEQDAREFSKRVNWATTLVVPVPSDVNYRNVTVEGVGGVLLEDLYAGDQPIYTLLWVKEGMFYALTGNGKLVDALSFVRSLE
jgi:hypothetical protein